MAISLKDCQSDVNPHLFSPMTMPNSIIYCVSNTERKQRDLTQSYDKIPYTIRKWKGQESTLQTTKSSITQRLRTGLGQSDGLFTAI